MKMKNKTKQSACWLLGVYCILLTWIILFKMTTDFPLLFQIHYRSINLIPYGASVVTNNRVDFSEMMNNVLAFVPLGVYLALIFPKWSFGKKILPIFGISFFYEVMQYILAIGGTDITDLINNTLGGVIGIGVFFLCEKILGRHTEKVILILALLCTIGLMALLGILLIANS